MSEAPNTVIYVDGRRYEVKIGTKISEITETELPCAGGGRCGKCRVTAYGELSAPSEAEINRLCAKEIELGTRLACQTRIMGECKIFTSSKNDGSRVLTDTRTMDQNIDPTFEKYGVAIDIGTTTMASVLYGKDGKSLATRGMLNPQGRFGADVISRIEASMNGSDALLAAAVIGAIDSLIKGLCEDALIDPCEIDRAVITGNTAMLYLLTKRSPVPLSRAPFIADHLFGETLKSSDIGITSLSENSLIYLPPCIGAFVGADTVCAILSSGMLDTEQKSLLVDIGTNGEIALFDRGNLSVCSTAAGPAFEGVGISCGMRGAPGAVDGVSIVNGELMASVIGNIAPKGICGSGLVDAIACMLDLEIIDETGYLEDDFVEIAKGVQITAEDIRMVQLAKSAIYSGICTLLHTSGTDAASLYKTYIAGGFGNYLNMRSAARIGLLPRELTKSIEIIGNAALSGASMLLLDKELYKKAEEIAKSAKCVELASNPVFAEFYMNSMMFD